MPVRLARPRLLGGRFAVEEPSRWESSETDGRAERPTERERRSQDVEIELAIAFSNVKNIDCQGKREAESLARQEALASAPASRAAFALC